MNNKKIMKVTSTIPLLLTLALTACGTQNSQLEFPQNVILK